MYECLRHGSRRESLFIPEYTRVHPNYNQTSESSEQFLSTLAVSLSHTKNRYIVRTTTDPSFYSFAYQSTAWSIRQPPKWAVWTKFELKNAPSYEALSYVWGNPSYQYQMQRHTHNGHAKPLWCSTLNPSQPNKAIHSHSSWYHQTSYDLGYNTEKDPAYTWTACYMDRCSMYQLNQCSGAFSASWHDDWGI